ncbi:D-alanyl-D-alanine dipeptidase [Candidatus Sororendozoicomonas aggregata]|uniref:D-alanyl-D-alanine dipeptidase n=1 Tax=Candidatus Sororendozoicomonas aggregata TaxID=3073239 RepID=UPI002ED3BF99
MTPHPTLEAITTDTFDVVVDMAYATNNNFTGQPVYTQPLCFLRKEAIPCLKKAIHLIKPLGLSLKIWDAYRPLKAQQALFNHTPDPLYVSHPETGIRPHCRGVALDVTLLDKHGNELPMGTGFDDFRPLAHHGNDQISDEAQKNRLLLAGIMAIAGFEPLDSEWWHYQLPNSQRFPILDKQS